MNVPWSSPWSWNLLSGAVAGFENREGRERSDSLWRLTPILTSIWALPVILASSSKNTVLNDPL